MSILLFSRVAYEQSFDTCFKDYDNLYQVWSIFSVKGEKFEPQEWNCGPVAGAILENFPKEVESATRFLPNGNQKVAKLLHSYRKFAIEKILHVLSLAAWIRF
jgi:hypothetical protein